MSSNMVMYLIGALTMIVCVAGIFGFPALAVVAVKYFKLKERELTLEMEYRQKSQEQHVAMEERVQRLEDTLSALDHDVRVQLGMKSLGADPERLEGPAAQDPEVAQPRDPSWLKAR